METNSSSLCESFETLRQNVLRTLHQKGYVQHQALNITVEHGTVTVEGSVPTWHLRQIALECVRRVAGVVRVVDRIRVVKESQDDIFPYLGPAPVQPATEAGRLEADACSTICVPVTDCLAA